MQVLLGKNYLKKMKGEIDGPPDTPYAGGKYQLAIENPPT
jgi:ubiquitin-protein ligase